MKKIKVPQLKYENVLGSLVLRSVEVLLEDDQYEKFKSGVSIEELDYGLSGVDIKNAEKQIALEFFEERYNAAFKGRGTLKKQEILAIQHFLNLNNVEFAKLIGIDKGALSNIYKRDSLSRPVCLLIFERLGMELSRSGSAKRMADSSAELSKTDPKISKEINKVRFHSNAA